jgi:hypothetical protein
MLLSTSGSVKQAIINLIYQAKTLGLPDRDCLISQEFLQHNEFGLAFDQIITQLYEYNVNINDEFCQQVTAIADAIKISPKEYSCILELVRC